MTIADNIRTRRKARKMTQIELAKRAGLSQAGLSTIEGGEDNVKVETLRGIATALGCATVDLLPEEDKRLQSLTRL